MLLEPVREVSVELELLMDSGEVDTFKAVCLVHSCVRAFVRSFVRSCVRAFVRSCVCQLLDHDVIPHAVSPVVLPAVSRPALGRSRSVQRGASVSPAGGYRAFFLRPRLAARARHGTLP